MRALVQRVSSAQVKVGDRIAGEIAGGLLIFLGVMAADTDVDLDFLMRKILALRIFPDSSGRMNLSVQDIKGELLVVSQFTLCADTKNGNRPSYTPAAAPEFAKKIYERALLGFAESGLKIAAGEFGADMKVALINDGPVTIWLDSSDA
jgi:D-tyrosyl-tRNA(Tyr) deacylase